ncbi:MAG: glycosyltransferase family 39 protein [Xenococcus sp. MO_188.B8]|nr:glycosyltransferase family 39 protein [Xenococcus sp. MO_188.B8]
MNRNWLLLQKKLGIFLLITLILGIFFRFHYIEQKIYWHDEVYTSIRIVGTIEKEMGPAIANGTEIGVEDLQKWLHLQPGKTVIDTLQSSTVDSHVFPLYYVLGHFWIQVFGDSIVAIRSLSAFLSLLVFPGLYWLCWELFQSSLTAWIAIALMAVSPFNVLYAQEARMYSLWTVLILFSSVALLRAMRLKKSLDWSIYGVTLVLLLYCHLFSLFVVLGQGIYVLITERLKFKEIFRKYLVTSIFSFLLFCPWIFVILTNLGSIRGRSAWAQQRIPPFQITLAWLSGIVRVFLDTGKSLRELGQSTEFYSIVLIFLTILIIFLIGFALFFVVFSRTKARVFLMALAIPVELIAILPALLTGKLLAGTIRYQIPMLIVIQISLAYLLAKRIEYQKQMWNLLLVLIITTGVVSCLLIPQSQDWWNKGNGKAIHLINAHDKPLVISHTGALVGNILSMSYYLKPLVRFRIFKDIPETLPQISEEFSDIFLFSPNEKLRNAAVQGSKYQLEVVKPKSSRLWRLIPLKDSGDSYRSS